MFTGTECGELVLGFQRLDVEVKSCGHYNLPRGTVMWNKLKLENESHYSPLSKQTHSLSLSLLGYQGGK